MVAGRSAAVGGASGRSRRNDHTSSARDSPAASIACAARALVIAAATFSRLRTIPASAISRATSASSNRATRSISNPANAARKFSRLRRIVSHDSPD